MKGGARLHVVVAFGACEGDATRQGCELGGFGLLLLLQCCCCCCLGCPNLLNLLLPGRRDAHDGGGCSKKWQKNERGKPAKEGERVSFQ